MGEKKRYNPKRNLLLAVLLVCGVTLVITLKDFRSSILAHGNDPGITCHSLTAQVGTDGDEVFTANAETSGSVTITGYLFTFGDQQSYELNFDSSSHKDREQAVVEHAYTKPGNYSVTVWVKAVVNGKQQQATSGSCQTTVTISGPSSQSQTTAGLPTTGPAHLPGTLLATICLGVVTYLLSYLYRSRLWTR